MHYANAISEQLWTGTLNSASRRYLAASHCQLAITGQCTFPGPVVLETVAVGTIIADRPPHRSVRALVSAYGSYLG
jgi:hypothetical protein